MTSAFGIEHISKSYVNGKWVKAAELTGKQAKKIAVGGQYKKAKGTTKFDRQFKAEQTQTLQGARKMKPGEKQRSLFTRVEHKGFDRRGNAKIDIQNSKPTLALPNDSGNALLASAQKIGHKRGGVHLLTTHGSGAASAQTIAHEKAHLSPSRGGYRLAQIVRSPKKLMREEARADAVADKKRGRPSPFARGINEVTSDPDRSGYAQAAAGHHLARSSEHVGATRGGRAAKKIPGLRKLVGHVDQGVRSQYDAQIVAPSLAGINRSLNTKKPIERKHLDEYKNVYDRVRGS
jgi:hypothetical protein